MKFVLLIHNASDLCRKTNRSTFDEPTGKTDGPCVDAFFRGYVGLFRRGRRLASREGLRAGNWRQSKANAIVADAILEGFMSDMGTPSPPVD
jgi:hypothetical protein